MTKNRLNLLLILALCTVTSAIYAQAAYFPFHLLDDPFVILGNTHLGFSLDSLKWAFTSNFTGNWLPVTWLSFMVDHALFGKVPMGYHIVNVLLHVVDTALLYLLLRYMTGAAWRSAAVAALFALHPLHVESVAWITERKDVLSALFWMGTLFFYAAYVKQGDRKWFFLSLASFGIGLMAKPMLVTLPLVLLLLDYWPLQRFSLFPLCLPSETPGVGEIPAAFGEDPVSHPFRSIGSYCLVCTGRSRGGVVIGYLYFVRTRFQCAPVLCQILGEHASTCQARYFLPHAPDRALGGGLRGAPATVRAGDQSESDKEIPICRGWNCLVYYHAPAGNRIGPGGSTVHG